MPVGFPARPRRALGRARRRRTHRRRAGFILAALAVAVLAVGLVAAPRRDGGRPPTPAPAATGAEPTPSPAPSPTPEPTAAPTAAPDWLRVAVRPNADGLPQLGKWAYRSAVYRDGAAIASPEPDESLAFSGDDAYAAVPGVLTFRGGNLRQNAAYGTAALERQRFKALWNRRIGAIDSGYATWSGVGWTGQPVLVRWPERLRASMNLKREYRNRPDLVEAIYGTLDGNIYFLDAETGADTRDPIRLGFPIKGSVSVDPRGWPLLYVGQGISRANGRTGRIGWRVYSLIDQRELYFLDGRDPLSPRDHGAFDGTCLVSAGADTVIEGGENGLFYAIRLNTDYDPEAGRIDVHPRVTAYRYQSAASPELGIEGSVAAYGRYAWFVDNSGLMTCMDLSAMAPVWLYDTGDDTDATLALEAEADGGLALYTVNQIDKRGRSGRCVVRRMDALTGVADWSFSVNCTSDGDNGGGGFASPAIGANAYRRYVYFNICRTESGGVLFCFDKQTGEVVWKAAAGSNSWSSPVLVYREDGTGVLVLGASGRLRMFDPASGRRLAEIEIEGKLEGSPAVFDDLLVVGTRGMRIYGIRLT